MENNEDYQNRIDLSGLSTAIGQIREEVSKIVVGQGEMVDLIITAILSDGHVLLEGVPGVAKTLTAKLIARVIDAGFSRIQFTPDLMPSDVLGTSVFNMKTSDFEFRKGPVFSNIILIDEINRAPAKTQAALFEVMEERQVTIDGISMAMNDPYLVLATQNPIEQEGTYRLPEAQLDRFLFKISIHYPTVEQEVEILQKHHEQNIRVDLDKVKVILTKEKINSFRAIVKSVFVEPHLLQYIANIVHDTRNDESIYLGASPRASVALLNAGKAYATLQGRDFVTPEDIKTIALPVLRHRLILAPEREMEGINADQIIKQTLDRVEVPR